MLVKLFPAWAGVIPAIEQVAQCVVTFPRMGGGDPDYDKRKARTSGFSPHGRG